jgi:hypothetical protein
LEKKLPRIRQNGVKGTKQIIKPIKFNNEEKINITNQPEDDEGDPNIFNNPSALFNRLPSFNTDVEPSNNNETSIFLKAITTFGQFLMNIADASLTYFEQTLKYCVDNPIKTIIWLLYYQSSFGADGASLQQWNKLLKDKAPNLPEKDRKYLAENAVKYLKSEDNQLYNFMKQAQYGGDAGDGAVFSLSNTQNKFFYSKGSAENGALEVPHNVPRHEEVHAIDYGRLKWLINNFGTYKQIKPLINSIQNFTPEEVIKKVGIDAKLLVSGLTNKQFLSGYQPKYHDTQIAYLALVELKNRLSLYADQATQGYDQLQSKLKQIDDNKKLPPGLRQLQIESANDLLNVDVIRIVSEFAAETIGLLGGNGKINGKSVADIIFPGEDNKAIRELIDSTYELQLSLQSKQKVVPKKEL